MNSKCLLKVRQLQNQSHLRDFSNKTIVAARINTCRQSLLTVYSLVAKDALYDYRYRIFPRLEEVHYSFAFFRFIHAANVFIQVEQLWILTLSTQNQRNGYQI